MRFDERVAVDLKEAMKAREATRVSTLRMLTAALHNARIAAGRDLDDGEAHAIVLREVKLRREAIEQFEKGGRDDLVAKERAEIAVLDSYVPPQLDRDEIVAEARKVAERVGAVSPSDKGKVMGPLMAELRGRADGRLVNDVVTELLGG